MLMVKNASSALSFIKGDGTIGLAPSNEANPKSESYVMKLYDDNIINKPIFSLYYGDGLEKGKIWFGDYDYSFIQEKLDYED